MKVYQNKEVARRIIESLKTGKSLEGNPHIQSDGIDAYFDHYFLKGIEHDPQSISCLGIFEPLGMFGHNAFLTDVSKEARVAAQRKILDHLRGIGAFDHAQLTSEQKLSLAVAEWELAHATIQERFLHHQYPINQLFGVLFDIHFLLTQVHELRTSVDIEHYLERLARIPVQFQQLNDYVLFQRDAGIVPPRFALEKVRTSIQKALPDDVREHQFYKRLKAASCCDENAAAKAASLLRDQVYPAYATFAKTCDMLISFSHTHGVWALPGGDEYYMHTLKQHTTTDLTADEIHDLGIQEVVKIQSEIRAILATEGIVDETRHVIDLLKEHEKNPDFYYPETDQGRADCIEDFNMILERCRKELHPLFKNKPVAGVTIHEVPVHEAEGAPGAYYFGPSYDGSRTGKFFVNTRSMAEIPKFRMETLAVHEAEPGHHFQIALQQETDLPAFRKFLKDSLYNAYVEGWALYTEKLAYEQGFYSSAWSKIGHLQDELMRAVRLVVDTGIHKKRWSKEKAVDYMVQELGMPYESVVTEIERYFVLPGQACSYKIGQLMFLALRKKMQDAVGDQFDIRDFHDLVLSIGAVPLTVLERVVDEYCNAK